MNLIPSLPSHNLFCYNGQNGVTLITYRDLMVYMCRWLDLLGENVKSFSSHSLRRGRTTHAYKSEIPESDIQRMGHGRSECFRSYIHDYIQNRIVTCMKFNKHT